MSCSENPCFWRWRITSSSQSQEYRRSGCRCAVAAIHSFSDFTTYEWDPLGLGYNSTTLFNTSGGTTSAITLIGVQTASLSDADFLFA